MNRIARLEYLQEISAAAGSPEATLRPLKDLSFVNAKGFHDAFFEYVKEGRTSIRLELSGVGFIDSGGVGTLVKLRKALEGSGGGLTILNPGATVQNILKLVGLTPLVKYEDVSAAAPKPRAGDPPPATPQTPGTLDHRPEPDDEVNSKIDQLLLGAASGASSPAGPPGADPRQVRVQVLENLTHLNAQALLDGLLGHLARGVTHVRVDVAKVDFIDSAGVGILLKAAKAFHGAGGELILQAPTQPVQRILKIVKLDRVLRIES